MKVQAYLRNSIIRGRDWKENQGIINLKDLRKRKEIAVRVLMEMFLIAQMILKAKFMSKHGILKRI